MQAKKPQIGRMVHYVLQDVGLAGQHRAAVIVQVAPGYNPEGRVNLIVFKDGPNDGLSVSKPTDARNLLRYVENVPHNQQVYQNGTWHYFEEEA